MRASPVLRYGVAIAAVVAATLVRAGFTPVLGARGPFVLMFIAVAVAGWYGGFGPGLLATILSAIIAAFLFIGQARTVEELRTDDLVFTGLFLAAGTMISILAESMHRARERAEAVAEKLRLEISERERVASELAQSVENEKKALAESEVANRAKDEFLATVSHELRTPLNSMLGWSQILQTGTLNEEDTQHALETIARNARHQSQLIDDVLDVSRIITGKVRLDVRPIDPIDVVQQAIDVVRPTAEAKGVRLQAVLDPNAGPVSGDGSRLQQVVWNLLSNAIKFTPRGGRIQIQLARVNSHIELVVSDTGEGIEPDFLPFVFERFRQSTGAPDRPHGGLGLGLAIVRHLVELHGGSVEARSDGPGRGSVFTVRLPLMITTLSTPEAEAEERSHPTADEGSEFEFSPVLTGIRILVAEDEPDARELIRMILTNCGAEVLACGSAAECFDQLRKWPADVLVSDVGMPGEDGYSLIERIRQLPPEEGGRIPAMALTAFARLDDRVRALAAGFQTHVPKPVEPAELVAAVASLAGTYRHQPERKKASP